MSVIWQLLRGKRYTCPSCGSQNVSISWAKTPDETYKHCVDCDFKWDFNPNKKGE